MIYDCLIVSFYFLLSYSYQHTLKQLKYKCSSKMWFVKRETGEILKFCYRRYFFSNVFNTENDFFLSWPLYYRTWLINLSEHIIHREWSLVNSFLATHWFICFVIRIIIKGKKILIFWKNIPLTCAICREIFLKKREGSEKES